MALGGTRLTAVPNGKNLCKREVICRALRVNQPGPVQSLRLNWVLTWTLWLSTTGKAWVQAFKSLGLRYSLFPPKGCRSVAGAGVDLSRKWLREPGMQVDVGSSYHTKAEFSKCWIVHPLKGT